MGREAQVISLQPRCLQACSKQGEKGHRLPQMMAVLWLDWPCVLLQLLEEPWVTPSWVLPRALQGPEPLAGRAGARPSVSLKALPPGMAQ